MRPRNVLVLAGVAALAMIVGVGVAATALRGIGAVAATPTPASRPVAQPATAPVPAPTVTTIAPTALPVTAIPEPTQVSMPPPQAQAPSGATLTVQGTGANGLVIRRTPGGERIASADEGEQVADLGQLEQAAGRDWRKVRAPDGTEGWAAAEFLAGQPAAVVAVVEPTRLPSTATSASAVSTATSIPPTPAPAAATARPATPATAPAKPAAPVAATKPTPPTPTAQREHSPEVLLAIIQHGAGVGPNDPRVPAFARQLDRLEAKCTEDRMKLADLTAGTNKVMADRGVREPILDTVSGVATASEGLPMEQECADTVFVGYATLRISGAPGAVPKR